MASLALHLKNHNHKTPKTLLKSTHYLTFSHYSSSSSSSNNNNNNGDDENPKPSTFSSYFGDIKSRLKQQESTGFRSQSQSTVPSSSSKHVSLDEIRKNLSEFRRRSTPESPSPSPEKPSLFQDVYARNLPNSANPNPNPGPRVDLSFGAIRESLRQLKATNANKVNEPVSSSMMNRFKPRSPVVGSEVIGGSLESLPDSVFGKELREKERNGRGEGPVEESESNELIRPYKYAELGAKLRELRPEVGKTSASASAKKKKKGGVVVVEKEEEKGFSLGELNERLKKLRVMEEQKPHDPIIRNVRKSIQQMKLSSKESQHANARVEIFSKLHGTEDFVNLPPKEHLVEKYFHPDNMSSAEKLKLELEKVRDEFKMHESDCGSARVQIAQLTTEILHLSSLLHKKDKHSRKGLLAKVQQRKKLLKYLRRTDWDSYCMVLSKLGLRDNPDYKN